MFIGLQEVLSDDRNTYIRSHKLVLLSLSFNHNFSAKFLAKWYLHVHYCAQSDLRANKSR